MILGMWKCQTFGRSMRLLFDCRCKVLLCARQFIKGWNEPKKATAMGKAYVVCQINFLTETHREAREFIENEYDLVRRLVFSLSMRVSSVSCFSFICVWLECVKFMHAMSVH